MPNTTGRFHMYSDTSKFATGSALYQIQNGKPKLIAYTSKRLPGSCKELLYYRARARAMQISNKHCKVFTFAQKS